MLEMFTPRESMLHMNRFNFLGQELHLTARFEFKIMRMPPFFYRVISE